MSLFALSLVLVTVVGVAGVGAAGATTIAGFVGAVLVGMAALVPLLAVVVGTSADRCLSHRHPAIAALSSLKRTFAAGPGDGVSTGTLLRLGVLHAVGGQLGPLAAATLDRVPERHRGWICLLYTSPSPRDRG